MQITFITILLLITIGFSNSVKNNLSSRSNISASGVFTDSLADDDPVGEDSLTDDPPNFQMPKDISGMFNERGYYKSNSISYDESEVISDFNGNLMYSIPMYKFKGAGDLNIDLSLNYNGSVSHNIYNGLTYQLSQTAYPLSQNSMSIPAWMFNFNGMGVQLLNFEEKFLTHNISISRDTIAADSVKLLANGYHITDRLKSVGSERDIITIMAGDGSTISLENVTSDYGPSTYYTGAYFATSTKSYIKAQVEFAPGSNNVDDTYKDRIMYLTKGDGLTYIYREYAYQFRDFTYWTSSPDYLKPQAFCLIEVRDKYGHSIRLTYNNETYGRPTLSSIYENYEGGNYISFNYHRDNNPFQNGKIDVTSSQGNYEIITNANGITKPRMMVTSIENPNHQIAIINYLPYDRKAIHVRNAYNSDLYDVTFILGLSRLSYFKNYANGIRTYTYMDESQDVFADMHPDGNIHVHSDFSHGQGRDEFFVNMLHQKTINDGVRDISVSTFSYPYTNGRFDEFTNPVDTNDIYGSKIITNSLYSDQDNNSDIQKTTENTYRNYPVKDHYHPSSAGLDQTIDIQGETKLIEKAFYSGSSSTPIRTISYQASNLPESALLDTMIVETVNGITTSTKFIYEQYSKTTTYPNLSLYTQNNPIKRKIEIDPFGKKTVTSYKLFDTQSIHYIKGIFNYTLTVTDEEENTYNIDTTVYYNNGCVDTVSVYDNAGNLLSRTLNTYCNDNGTVDLGAKRLYKPNGYITDIINSKQYNTQNLSEYLEEKYYYYNNDTLGKFMYPGIIKPSSEGNLRMKISAESDTTVFYYNLNNLQEAAFTSPEAPKLKYRVIYQDGRDMTESKKWQDIRLPVKTESHNRTPFPILTYNLYNPAGLITDYVDANKNITILRYDSTNRIQAITQPYDFVDLYEYTVYDTTYDQTTFSLKPYALGSVNTAYISPDHYSPFNAFGGQDWFNMQSYYVRPEHDVLDSLDAMTGYLEKKKILIDYRNSQVPDFIQIDSIKLKIYPIVRDGNVSGSDVTDSNTRLVVTPLDTFYYYDAGGTIHNYYELDYDNATGHLIQMPAPTGTVDCTNESFHYNKLDITSSTLQHMIDRDNRVNFCYMIDIEPNPHMTLPLSHNVFLNFTLGCNGFNSPGWKLLYAPVLEIKGTKRNIRPRVITSMDSATVRYKYINSENKVRTLKKLTNYAYKINETYFDGFYKPVKSKMFTSSVLYDSSLVYYNYLDQKSKVTDGLNHATKFSYDKYNNLSQTENTDNSSSYTTSTYISSLTTSLDTFTNVLINVQEFKDETDRLYIKYIDAVGRLLRETRYVSIERSEEDGPFNPDSTEMAGDNPGDIPLHTDYKYDALYRVIEVNTPQGKHIYYTYDGLGRQIQRETPDAGIVIYKYNKGGSLRFSQDDNQAHAPGPTRPAKKITFRRYDGLNRLLASGEALDEGDTPSWSSLNPESTANFESYASYPDNFLTINVYDTLSTAIAGIFGSPPSDYYSAGNNNTKGSLTATAFRTLHGADWNYKYYRYDSRGRVIKMWQYLYGLGWKSEKYYYNSQNQIKANEYQPGAGDAKSFSNSYDFAGRLLKVSAYYGSTPQIPEENSDSPALYENLSEYLYNQNSQISTQFYKAYMPASNFSYDTRNRLRLMESTNSGNTFLVYGLEYNANGNIRHQYIGGNYKNNFDNTDDLNFDYIYDKSNRLVKSNATIASSTENVYDVTNIYDKDGNIQRLIRYQNEKNPSDDFTYEYESNTNKLLRIRSLGTDEYAYDYNGNVLKDSINEVWDMKYDYRNLLLSCVSINPDLGKPNDEPVKIYYTEYIYDEAGNRINKKVYQYTGLDPEPVHSDTDSPGLWTLQLNEYYVRNVSGAEVALYKSTAIEFWNIWGSDNVGRINADTTKQFYLKDHLGSIRCVINAKSQIISAQDLDAWGYKMTGRKFDVEKCQYKFTSKERDIETDYDYFGARYYDSKIGRWGQLEPLYDKSLSLTPYCYSSNLPTVRFDINGLDDFYFLNGSTKNSPSKVDPKSGENRYFFETKERNHDVVYLTLGQKGGNAHFFTEANSETTKNTYFEFNTTYDMNNVILHQSSDVISAAFAKSEQVNSRIATMEIMGVNPSIAEAIGIAFSSRDKQPLDFKNSLPLNDKSLHLINGKLYNQQEAGNYYWGANMALNTSYGLWASQTGGEIYSLISQRRRDEPNEQKAIKAGYKNNE